VYIHCKVLDICMFYMYTFVLLKSSFECFIRPAHKMNVLPIFIVSTVKL